MLLSLLSDQLPELVQAVWQAVVQPEHHPEFLDPIPGSQGGYHVTDTKHTIKVWLLKCVHVLNWPDEVAYPLALRWLLIVHRYFKCKGFG